MGEWLYVTLGAPGSNPVLASFIEQLFTISVWLYLRSVNLFSNFTQNKYLYGKYSKNCHIGQHTTVTRYKVAWNLIETYISVLDQFESHLATEEEQAINLKCFVYPKILKLRVIVDKFNFNVITQYSLH